MASKEGKKEERKKGRAKTGQEKGELTICPETITEIIRFEFLRCKNYVTAPEINSPETQKSPEITVRKSFKSPVRITAHQK